MRSLRRLLAITILSLPLVAAMPALADNSQGNENQNILAPEIDPDLLGGVVTLLAGGLLILRERRRA